MMLTVHGLPNKTKFQDVKALIKQECNIPDFILDNLEEDGYDSKKIRIGLTNENDGYRLMKYLEGFRMSGSHVLRVVPVGKPPQPQPKFEPRSSYSNQPRNDYPNKSQRDYSGHDYSRGQANNPITRESNGSTRNSGAPDARNFGSHTESRGLMDARQSLSQAMADTRAIQERYQGSSDHRPDHRNQTETRSADFRDVNQGPLAPPAIRPASMEIRSHVTLDTRGPHGSIDSRNPRVGLLDPVASTMRGQDYRNQISNPEPINTQQWNPGNDQWSSQIRPIPNQNMGFNYQQPQGNTGYSQPINSVLQSNFAQGRTPQMQGYQQQQPKIAVPDRTTLMKDNFQGPTQYNVTGQAPQPQGTYGQGTQSTWGQQGQVTKQLTYDKSYDERRLALEKRSDVKPAVLDYEKQRYSPTRSGRQTSPGRSPTRKIPTSSTRPSQIYPERRSPPRSFTERRVSPSRHVTSSITEFLTSTRRISPSNKSPQRKVSPYVRKVTPPGRHNSPRKDSPMRRRTSIGKRTSPDDRHISPFSRNNSPSRRRMPSTGRLSSPARRMSPRRHGSSGRMSPSGKRNSPGRDETRRMSPSMTKYGYYVEDERRMGGRLESPRRYSPKRSPRRGSERFSPSETYESELPSGKSAKPIRPAYEANKAQKYAGSAFRPNETQYAASGARNEPKIPVWMNEKISYPIKKDDRDVSRMGRSDPTVKKQSPRRSRSRSPVKDRYRRHSPSPRSPRRSWALEKRHSPEAIREPPPPPLWPGQEAEEKPHTPVWERNTSSERRFDDKRERNQEKYTPRFSPRRDIDDRREYREERDYHPKDRDDYRAELHREKKLFPDVDKDFNDIYQRAVEFRRKTEQLRKSNDHRHRSYDDEESPGREEPQCTERIDKQKPNWIPIKFQSKDPERNKIRLDPAVKDKRDKAVNEIANRLLEPHDFTGEQKQRVMEELKLSIYNIMLEMFKDKDVSYIELVIKFRARYDAKDEEKILLDVLRSMPSHYKNSLKRKIEGMTDVPPKISRRSPTFVNEEPARFKLADSVVPDWNMGLAPPKVLSLPIPGAPPSVVNAGSVMVQPPPVYVPTYQVPQEMYHQSLQSSMHTMQANLQAHLQSNLQSHMQSIQHDMQPHIQPNIQTQMHPNMQSQIQSYRSSESELQSQMREQSEGYNLYLCQDDFEPFSENQAEKLKNFLVSQMFKASETGDGWAPVFTLKGLHSMHRYELSTKDEASMNWIINLDFSEFDFFNVLVYTKEELWYERAAIWLPGHSRYRNLEPLEKLRLQNHHVEGIKIGKWKFVKKIVTLKGTRLYVDMPPSSARVLEKQKMMLSYELGKVNVYLKAVAVDKEVFDAGLKAHSITDPSQIAAALQSVVMPTLPSQTIGIVKVTLNGAKSITIQQAGKIKEMIVYNLFKYHQTEGRSRTDFLRYGFCPPNCIGIVPENNESKRWLMGRAFGKLNRQVIIVVDGEEVNTKYFRMRVTVPSLKFYSSSHNIQASMERLRTSNQGVKGLNFQFWKAINLSHDRGKCYNLEIDVDLESAETLMKMQFKLDYVDDNGTSTVVFKSDYSLSKLEEKIRKYKSEMVDSYDVANMDLDSNSDS